MASKAWSEKADYDGRQAFIEDGPADSNGIITNTVDPCEFVFTADGTFNGMFINSLVSTDAGILLCAAKTAVEYNVTAGSKVKVTYPIQVIIPA